MVANYNKNSNETIKKKNAMAMQCNRGILRPGSCEMQQRLKRTVWHRTCRIASDDDEGQRRCQSAMTRVSAEWSVIMTTSGRSENGRQSEGNQNGERQRQSRRQTGLLRRRRLVSSLIAKYPSVSARD